MFTVYELTIHGKTKWQLVYTQGGKHIAYFNDSGEARAVLRLLNAKYK
jgi:hypothetical protein